MRGFARICNAHGAGTAHRVHGPAVSSTLSRFVRPSAVGSSQDLAGNGKFALATRSSHVLRASGAPIWCHLAVGMPLGTLSPPKRLMRMQAAEIGNERSEHGVGRRGRGVAAGELGDEDGDVLGLIEREVWMGLDERLVKGLNAMGIKRPTEIQQKALALMSEFCYSVSSLFPSLLLPLSAPGFPSPRFQHVRHNPQS